MTEKKKILIVVDMQHDFVDGAFVSEAAQAIVPKVEEKILNGGYDEIFYTFDTHYLPQYWETLEGKNLPPHCIKGTPGWCSVLSTNMSERSIVEKKTFAYTNWNRFIHRGPSVWDEDEGRDEVIVSIELVGLCTDICVIANALELKAHYSEIPITVDASCCAGTTPEAHKAALAVMKSCQIDVINE